MNKDKVALQNTDIGKDNHLFEDIVKIVESAKDRAYKKVNEELILMYQEVENTLVKKLRRHLMAPVSLIM